MRFALAFIILLICSVVILCCAGGRSSVVSAQATTSYGYFDVDVVNGGRLYYTFVQSSVPDASNVPVVLWLNGGPGCSSMLGLYLENGPQLYDEATNALRSNAYSWHNIAHMLYIDAPVGVGYSTVANEQAIPNTAAGNAVYLLRALRTFFTSTMPSLKLRPFYIAGESYGAKYAIALANLILDTPEVASLINLRGIALGNGWVNPSRQESVYGNMAYHLALSNYQEMVQTNAAEKTCHALIQQGLYYRADREACAPMWLQTIRAGGAFNPYDYRIFGVYGVLDKLEAALDQSDFKTSIKVSPTVAYKNCNANVFRAFLDEFQQSSSNIVPRLMQNMQVLVYNGQFDLRCNVAGTSEWLRLLNWDGRAGFNFLDHDVFYVGNTTSGIFKSYKNLTQVVIYDAGHLVPYDAPVSSLEMMRRFVYGQGMCSSWNQVKNGGCKVVQCPNDCSQHGKCDTATGKCVCDEGFSREDCSLFKRQHLFGRSNSFNGKMYGQNLHIYHLDLDEFGFGNYDFKIKFSKLSRTGKLHLFAKPGVNFTSPDEENPEDMRFLYPFQSLEDIDSKTLEMNDMPRGDNPRVSVVVFNTIDSEAQYKITFTPVVSGLKLSGTSVAVISGTAILLTIATLLGVVAASQRLYDTAQMRMLARKKAVNHPRG